jgi:hypothetical protein
MGEYITYTYSQFTLKITIGVGLLNSNSYSNFTCLSIDN